MNAEEITRLLESMGESYFEIDLRGRLTLFNDHVCRFHGRTRDELTALDYHTFMRPGDAKKVFQIFNKVYRTGKPSELVEYDIIRKDGALATEAETIVSLRRGPAASRSGFAGFQEISAKRKKWKTRCAKVKKSTAAF